MRNASAILAILVLTGALRGDGVESLEKRSPFLPASALVADTAKDALSTIELTGILSIGGRPQFSIRDTTTGRAVWLALGETQDGLTVRSYDEAAASVVVEGRGASRSLVIREARIATAVPVPTPVVVTTQQQPPQGPVTRQVKITPRPPKPQKAPDTAKAKTDAEAERDARMLVSDLMEISMQERRRYEENQRRAARGLPRLEPGESLPPTP